ncbi:MAG: phospholipase A [Bdellovibrionales bacterium]|nr:phospholipase A [Bdellovibrionales bacterium]
MKIVLALLFLSLNVLAETADRSKVETKEESTPQPQKTVEDLYEEENSLLQRHHPFYFAYGSGLSKLQLSFKTPLIREVPLYFGYTQFMFWSLRERSYPFRDINYNPELFYRWHLGQAGVLKSIDLGGWEHNSNGRAGAESRSYDTNYVRFNLEKAGTRWTTRATVQLSYLHGFDDSNRDIQNYISPLSLHLSFIQLFDSWVDKSEISLQASPGGKFADQWQRGGYQISWSFRIGRMDMIPAFYLQYYRGYAENLLNYNQEVNQFRGGVIF